MKKKMSLVLVVGVVGIVIANILDHILGVRYPDPRFLIQMIHEVFYLALGGLLGIGFSLWALDIGDEQWVAEKQEEKHFHLDFETLMRRYLLESLRNARIE